MRDEQTRARLIALGEKLKQRRLEKGMTLTTLAEASGVHQSYLGRIERAERRPSAPILRQLANPLGFNEVELLRMAGYLSPDQVDDRIATLKNTMKCEIAKAMGDLKEKVDTL